MNREPSQDLLDRFRSQDTYQLIDLMKRKAQTNETNETDEELEVIKHTLERRQVRFPDMTKMPVPVAEQRDMRPLGIESNASACSLEPEKIEIHFPKQGFLRCYKSEFKNQEELVSYLCDVFL